MKYQKGTKVKHQNGSEIEIIEVLGSDLIYTCSYCSKDLELFPEGVFKTARSIINNGGRSCLCSKKPQLDENKNKIRVERVCLEKGYKFLGWEGDYISDRTYLRLHNPSTGNTWKTTNLYSFLQGTSDPSITRKPKREDSVHIDDFMRTGKFLEGTIFRRTNLGSLWEYTCPVCSVDAYVDAEVCSGTWVREDYTFKNGSKPCRCSPNYRYTKEQRLFQLNNLGRKDCEKILDVFSGAVYWICNGGHNCKTSTRNFLKMRGCMECYNINKTESHSRLFGYYNNRKYESDYLYLVIDSEDTSYFKIGRSFYPEDRIRRICRETGRDLKVSKIFKGTHNDVFRCEQKVLKHFKDSRIVKEYSTECLLLETFEDVVTFLNSEEALQQSDLVKVLSSLGKK